MEEIIKEEETGSVGLPSLPTALNSLYQSLDLDNKRLFLKIFRFIWGEVLPLKRFVNFSGILYSFWAVDILRSRLGLSPSELSALTYLYQVSKKGKLIVRSSVIYEANILPSVVPSSRVVLLNSLKRAGYITRQTRNTQAPHYSSSYSKTAVFLRLSPAGVRLVEDMERDLYKVLVNNCLDDLKGTNKKPRKRSPQG
jgi:DNA-binding MarR family transcriptional regulator